MFEDSPPNEALDACLYAIDITLAALRADLAHLQAIDATVPGAVATGALTAYVRWIERVIEHAATMQIAVVRR